MARAKSLCRGRNDDGATCKNWALRNSYYCRLHQNQITNNDVEDMGNTNKWAAIVVFIIFVVGFLISFAAGCEDKFLK